ncbi:MAG: cardiolipin synthase [Chthoniobacter sp.]|jgi:cardiolipin synthase|nr:cardiolipin synthase [Chthoniobacter sp.]
MTRDLGAIRSIETPVKRGSSPHGASLAHTAALRGVADCKAMLLSIRPPALLTICSLFLAGCAAAPRFQRPLPSVTAIRHPDFRQSISAVLGGSIVEGNRIVTLNNGAAIFPAMLGAIRNARQTINFETFIFYDGDIPKQFADALAERARAGVRVHVVLDAVGGNKSRALRQQMQAAGVEVAVYNSLFWWDLRRYNHRTHRKLLIVDGRIGFIGGVGIADEWAGNAASPKEWRDLHYRVEGPVVAQLQGTFLDNWLKTRGEVLQGPGYFPPLPRVGTAAANVFFSSPRHQRFSVELMYHLAIASTQRSLRITNAYFLPDRDLTKALVQAARRGVDVQIIMPGEHIDQKAVRRASRKRWPELLAAGIRLYEYEPTMIHTKLLIADDYFVSVGSANFDPRSLRINDEANLNVLDLDFARQQGRIFATDLRHSRPVNHEREPVKRTTELPAQTVQKPVESQL